ncbi:MAG: hypothetical protein FWC09_00965 [Lachnospiraceae bacterium]|nr:hypothetical protein [Lachnospiraceae bacterium]
MKTHYDFSKGRKNPYAEKLKKEGYSITINYSPQDVENMDRTECNPTLDEKEDFERYKKASGES